MSQLIFEQEYTNCLSGGESARKLYELRNTFLFELARLKREKTIRDPSLRQAHEMHRWAYDGGREVTAPHLEINLISESLAGTTLLMPMPAQGFRDFPPFLSFRAAVHPKGILSETVARFGYLDHGARKAIQKKVGSKNEMEQLDPRTLRYCDIAPLERWHPFIGCTETYYKQVGDLSHGPDEMCLVYPVLHLVRKARA